MAGYGRLTFIGERAQMSQLVVEPGCRKRGVGPEILRRLVEKSGATGVVVVCLHARLAFVPFYERFGLRAAGGVFPFPTTGLAPQRMDRTLPR